VRHRDPAWVQLHLRCRLSVTNVGALAGRAVAGHGGDGAPRRYGPHPVVAPVDEVDRPVSSNRDLTRIVQLGVDRRFAVASEAVESVPGEHRHSAVAPFEDLVARRVGYEQTTVRRDGQGSRTNHSLGQCERPTRGRGEDVAGHEAAGSRGAEFAAGLDQEAHRCPRDLPSTPDTQCDGVVGERGARNRMAGYPDREWHQSLVGCDDVGGPDHVPHSDGDLVALGQQQACLLQRVPHGGVVALQIERTAVYGRKPDQCGERRGDLVLSLLCAIRFSLERQQRQTGNADREDGRDGDDMAETHRHDRATKPVCPWHHLVQRFRVVVTQRPPTRCRFGNGPAHRQLDPQPPPRPRRVPRPGCAPAPLVGPTSRRSVIAPAR